MRLRRWLCRLGWHRRPQLYGHDGRDWLLICPACHQLGLQSGGGGKGMVPVNLWDDDNGADHQVTTRPDVSAPDR